MTSPIQRLPGVGDEIAAGLGPGINALINALGEKQQRETAKQNALTQLGQLKLEQDKFAEENKARSEKKKHLEEAGLALQNQMNQFGQPTTGDLLLHALQANDAQLFQAVLGGVDAGSKLQELGASRENARTAGEEFINSPMAQPDIVKMFGRVIAGGAATERPAAISALGNIQSSSQRGQYQRNKLVTVQVGDKRQMMLIDGVTGQKIADVGQAGINSTDYARQYGLGWQQSPARAAVVFKNATYQIRQLSNDPAALAEATNALSAMEAAGRFPWVGDLAGFGGRVGLTATLSPEAQQLTNAYFDLLSAQGFGEGGKTLTKGEWDAATKAFMPLATDAPATVAAKLQRADIRGNMFAKQGGPAFERLKGDLFNPDDASVKKPSGGARHLPGNPYADEN